MTMTLAAGMSEKQLDMAIRRLCHDLRLLVFHAWDARKSGAGFPDLVIAGPRGLLFAELKTMTGRLRPEQETWRDLLLQGGAAWHLWRPDSLTDGTIGRHLAQISHLKP